MTRPKPHTEPRQDCAALLPLRGLEEVRAPGVGDMPAAIAFALARIETDARPVLLAVSSAWRREHGRPCAHAFAGNSGRPMDALILVSGRDEAALLWAMEQALRSGAVSLAVGGVERADLAQSRRLQFAAREGNSAGVLLRRTEGGLNAAGRRWRITTQASELNADDARSPGATRFLADLLRSRTERPGSWMMEQDDETHRLRLADRLVGDGLVEHGRTRLVA